MTVFQVLTFILIKQDSKLIQTTMKKKEQKCLWVPSRYKCAACMYQQKDLNRPVLQIIDNLSHILGVYSLQNHMQNGCEIWYTYWTWHYWKQF